MRLLMVDDDPAMGEFVRHVADALGYEVETHTSSEEFKAAIARGSPDVIVLDLSIPGTDGIELLRYLSGRRERAKIFIMSGFEPEHQRMAMALGEAQGLAMAGIIAKPVRVAELKAMLAAPRAAPTEGGGA